jgi:ATP-binding cassette subfamily C protein
LPNRPLKAFDLLTFGFFKLRRDRNMILLMAISGALLGLLPPIASGIIFDTIIPEADRYGLLYLGAILISAAIATGLFEATKIYSTLRLVSKMDFRLQSGIMDRLLSLPALFFRDYSAGDLAERTLGINAIREILSGATLSSMMGGIFSSASLALLFYYSWQLALVAIGITAVSVSIVIWAGYLQIRYQRTIADHQGKLSGMVLQLISGISKIRVSGTEDRAFAAWAETFGAMRKPAFKAAKISNYLYAFTIALPAISLFIIFGWIAFTPLMEKLSVGNIIAFNVAFAQFQMGLLQLAMTLISSLQVIPLYERAKPILEAVPEVNSGKAGPGILSGHIEVNNINFHYDPNGPLILNDVSMEIQPGEFVAVVGGSGSGKSTLLRLLLSFETPASGSIYYDSQDLATLDVTAVRRQLGVVLQNGSVMPGDIFSNIVGSANLSLDDAWEAARMAGLEQDIQAMPMGMHTMISPGGGTLSGGQRQRMLIARAIVHKPRIIYFDEATSALDNATQKIVSQSLEQLNATRVVIAHRLSTIKNADKIFVMNKGRIEQQGTYLELMDQSGLFADLAKRQIV